MFPHFLNFEMLEYTLYLGIKGKHLFVITNNNASIVNYCAMTSLFFFFFFFLRPIARDSR